MNISATLLSVGIAVAAVIVVTIAVSAGVRRSPATATYRATKTDVLFVVSTRRWQRVMLRTFGIAVLILGLILSLVATTRPSSPPSMGIAGVAMVTGGGLFILLAKGMARLRLEVTPDTVWVFPMFAAPRAVAVVDLTALAPHESNNYGGILGKSGPKTRLSANRTMLGYPQLIEYFHHYRPDLSIPDDARPLQERSNVSSRARAGAPAITMQELTEIATDHVLGGASGYLNAATKPRELHREISSAARDHADLGCRLLRRHPLTVGDTDVFHAPGALTGIGDTWATRTIGLPRRNER